MTRTDERGDTAGRTALDIAVAQLGGVDRLARWCGEALGANAVEACAAEQPDLLLVEDQLPVLPGPAAVLAGRQFSPGRRIVAQVGSANRIGDRLDAGAAAAFARQVPPADVAAALAELATDQDR